MRKNYDLNESIVKRLEEISNYYGINQTAAISMLITEKYLELKENIKENKEE